MTSEKEQAIHFIKAISEQEYLKSQTPVHKETWRQMLECIDVLYKKPNYTIYNNAEYEEESALFDSDEGVCVLRGDFYHNKIDSLIEGYLMGAGVDIDDVEKIEIYKDHEYFKLLEFYEGD